MKGVIVDCLQELVETQFGEDKWKATLKGAGLDADTRFLPIDDVDDAAVMKVIGSACGVLGISTQDAADAFGKYWACTFAPRMYGAYYAGITSAKEFLLKMESVHDATTRSMANAHPPHFAYEDPAPDVLVMEYRSPRGLMPFFTGLVKGVAANFGEKAAITPVGGNKIRIQFSKT